MKVLISAYACEPGAGSEPGAGWTWARAAARHHEIWLLTRANNREPIESALRAEGLPSIHPVYVDLPPWSTKWKKGQRGIRSYYFLWQRRALWVARRLHRQIRFDVAHHLTLAVDWMPAGVSRIPGLPFVWGPVGGTTGVPRCLWRWLGLRGCLLEAARELITRPMRFVFGDAVARRAALVVAQNRDVAARFAARASAVVVEPNVAFDAGLTTRARCPVRNGGRALFVGRLLPWKGMRLALAALVEEPASQWRLDVYGDGPERPTLERMAARLGLSERVTFHGLRPRAEILDALSTVDALLFPSLHDAAGWSVGEALALGCPVVCLDRGGPPLLIGEQGGVAVPASGTVARELAQALEQVVRIPSFRLSWGEDRLPDLLDEWYERAVQGRGRTRTPRRYLARGPSRF
jgi:glycosyltransferase involved in cell wall biosynthesis